MFVSVIHSEKCFVFTLVADVVLGSRIVQGWVTCRVQSFTCCADKCCLSNQTSHVMGEQRRVSIWFLQDLTQTQPLNLFQTHTLIVCAALSRQEECCRLTQRKWACRPVLTQGPSLLWPGQCPTVSLDTARAAQETAPRAHYFTLKPFLHSDPYLHLFPLACLSSAVIVHM